MPPVRRRIIKGSHGGDSLSIAPGRACHLKTVSTGALIWVCFWKMDVFMIYASVFCTFGLLSEQWHFLMIWILSKHDRHRISAQCWQEKQSGQGFFLLAFGCGSGT
jgi:hypothetical protein